MINFQDFQKIDLKIARILKAEKLESSEKLLKLEIDLGQDPSASSGQDPSASSGQDPSASSGQDPSASSGQASKQIIAGLAQFYSPEELIGKEIVVVVNLEPRVILSLESQGMLLAADDEGKPVLLAPDKEVPPGTRIR